MAKAASAAAQGWLTTVDEIATLRELCVTDNCRIVAGMLISETGRPFVDLSRFDSPADLLATVAQYRITSMTALTPERARA